MTREQAKELLPIIQAFAEGKTIQIKKEGDWFEVGENTEVYFSESPSDYRIKPKPKYRPFKNQEECWEEMLKHQPFGWVKDLTLGGHQDCRGGKMEAQKVINGNSAAKQ